MPDKYGLEADQKTIFIATLQFIQSFDRGKSSYSGEMEDQVFANTESHVRSETFRFAMYE